MQNKHADRTCNPIPSKCKKEVEVETLNVVVPLALDHDAPHLEDDNRQQHLKFAQQ